MTMTPQRILLFLAGLLVAGLGAAYYGGVFDRPVGEEVAAQAAPSESTAVNDAGESKPAEAKATTEAEAEELGSPAAAAQQPAEKPAQESAAAANSEVVVPTFDLLRVAPDGSLVIAGRAAPNSSVEIVAGTAVLATAKSGANGDFASVLDRALKPGEHTVVLRSTSSEKVSATSLETAIVSVPSEREGEVVALVQQPGQPSRLISVPDAESEQQQSAQEQPNAGDDTVAAEDEKVVPDQPNVNNQPADAGSQPADSNDVAANETGNANPSASAPAEQDTRAADAGAQANAGAQADASERASADSRQLLAATGRPVPESQPQPVQRNGTSPFIEAVEIDGREIFVAGQAAAGKRVRVYVNDVLLGQATVEANGRFLIQTERNLPVGDYIVRADVLGNDGVSVTARAAVPFARQAGESMTSIAPVAPQSGLVAENAGQEAGGAVASQASQAMLEGGETSMAPALQREDGAVIIRKGDTLWHISRRVYGRGMRYTTIYQANKDQIRNPNLIWPGQTFALPASSEEGEAADRSTIGAETPGPKAAE